MSQIAPHSRKKICYYYDSDIGNYYYGQVSRIFKKIR